MDIGREIVEHGLRLDDPLGGAIACLVYQLCGIVPVQRLDVSVSILHVGAIDLELLDKHLSSLSLLLLLIRHLPENISEQ
jgi:hypothetical protein